MFRFCSAPYEPNGDWVGIPGPQLKSSGSGPVAVNLVAESNVPGGSDLLVTNGQSGTLALLPSRGQGFFDDRNPQIFTIPGNPVIGPPTFLDTKGDAVVVTAKGQLVEFNIYNFAATVHYVYNPSSSNSDVVAVQPGPDGVLVGVLQDGIVALLQENAISGVFDLVQDFTPLNGIPDNPARWCCWRPLPGWKLLVTNQGQDQLFLFGFDASGPLSSFSALNSALFLPLDAAILLSRPSEAVVPIAEATAPSEAPFALFVTLITAELPAAASSAEEDSLSSGNGGTDVGSRIENFSSSGDQPPIGIFSLGIEEALAGFN